MVRALASQKCGPGSNPDIDAICGLSLFLVLFFAPRGFSLSTPVFALSSKTNISKFQFDQESGRQRTTLWMCYLQIIIYLFVIYLSNESLLLVVVVAQVFKKPHVEKGEGSNKENEEVDNSKLNPTGE